MKLLDSYSYYNFSKNSKKYNVNVFKQSRMVHKKDGCYYSHLYQFIPFDTLEEIKAFEEKNNIKFTFCQNPACGFKET